MSLSATRLELRIDIFENKEQEALVLAELKPPELLAAILQEFDEIEYLGDVAADYRLVRAEDGTPLNDEAKLGDQVEALARLVLEEKEIGLPDGTRRPPDHTYLHETVTGKTFRIGWLPAIVGRVSATMSHNDRVVADLSAFPTGLSVSRRHFVLDEEDGEYYIQALSSNPVSVVQASQQKHGQENKVSSGTPKLRLCPGDLITLDRAEISLKFVVRKAPATQIAAPVAEGSAPEPRESALATAA